ncbi:MAG: MBL fold metallo-hydrolase [Fibrobacter sp.]|nr:MBL fold metallo-hydrolase [Fibrobacter sp.]
MRLKIFGSSSAGNCYLLDNGKEALMIEAGVNIKNTIVKEMGMSIARIAGCLISHEHGDHTRDLRDVTRKYRIPTYASQGTAKATGNQRIITIEPNQMTRIGGFKVIAWDAMHDAAQPFGFLIWHEDMGWLLFATDTYCIPVSINGINHIVIECNYSEDLIEANYKRGIITKGQYTRTLKSHMSLQGCKEYLQSQDLSKAWDITLIHLSDGNSDEERFAREIQEIAGAGIVVRVAPKKEISTIDLYR